MLQASVLKYKRHIIANFGKEVKIIIVVDIYHCNFVNLANCATTNLLLPEDVGPCYCTVRNIGLVLWNLANYDPPPNDPQSTSFQNNLQKLLQIVSALPPFYRAPAHPLSSIASFVLLSASLRASPFLTPWSLVIAPYWRSQRFSEFPKSPRARLNCQERG